MTPDLKRDLKEGFVFSLLYQAVLVGIVFCFILFHQKVFSFSLLSQLWNAWDGNTYVLLAQHGYQTTGDEANYIVFYPLYPLLVGIITRLGIEVHLAGVFVTTIGSIIGHTAFYLWLRERGLTVWQARRVLFLFFVNPVTVYFTLVCTEGVFLAFVALFFLFLYRRSYALAAVLGLFAAATRLVGITLVVPFVFFFLENHLARVEWKRIFWVILIPLGFLLFLGINYTLYHDPFHYQGILKENWSKSVVNPVTQYIYSLQGVLHFFPTQNITYAVDIIATLSVPLFLLLYIGIKRKHIWLAGVGFSLANIFIITAQSYWLSNTRYISLILPIYMFIEELTRKKLTFLYILLSFVFGVLSLYGISLFARGGWLY